MCVQSLLVVMGVSQPVRTLLLEQLSMQSVELKKYFLRSFQSFAETHSLLKHVMKYDNLLQFVWI